MLFTRCKFPHGIPIIIVYNFLIVFQLYSLSLAVMVADTELIWLLGDIGAHVLYIFNLPRDYITFGWRSISLRCETNVAFDCSSRVSCLHSHPLTAPFPCYSLKDRTHMTLSLLISAYIGRWV